MHSFPPLARPQISLFALKKYRRATQAIVCLENRLQRFRLRFPMKLLLVFVLNEGHRLQFNGLQF